MGGNNISKNEQTCYKAIWLLQRRSSRGGDFTRAYISRINAKDDMYNDISTEKISLWKNTEECRAVCGDDRGVIYTNDGIVRFEWSLTPCELNEDPEPYVGPSDDKFYLGSGTFTWRYFNPDGFGEKGQYVENTLTVFSVLEGVRRGYGKDPDEFFMGWLSQEATQYLYDNDGSDEFMEYDRSFRGDPYDFIGCTEETMNALLEWAKEETKEDQ